MTPAREDLIRYRMTRARDSLADARLLASNNRWLSCTNRIYYACFYAVTALLLQHGLSSPKHKGVRGLFNLHFVRTGKIPKEIAKTYNLLFERRQEADYMDLIQMNGRDVQQWLEETARFVEYIRQKIDVQ